MILAQRTLPLLLCCACTLLPVARAAAQDPAAQNPAAPAVLPAVHPDPAAAARDPAIAAQNPAPPPAPDPRLYGAGRELQISLDGALDLALQQNLGLALEAVNSDLSFANYRASYGTFDWLFHANVGYTDTHGPVQSVFGGEDITSQDAGVDFTRFLETGGTFRAGMTTLYSKSNSSVTTLNPSTRDVLALTYTQPLLRGAWRDYNTEAQRESELVWRQQLERERQSRQQLLRDVSFAYWDLVAARDDLAVKVSGLELARAQVDQDQRRLDAGVGTRLDVLQSETQSATREQDRLLADVRLKGAGDRLKALLFPGKDIARWETTVTPKTLLPEDISTEKLPPWTHALEIALDERSELRQQRYQIDIMALRHELRRSEKLSQLDLELGASGEGFSGDSGSSLDDSLGYANPTYSARLNYSIPIGNTQARWGLEAARADLRAARLQYDQLESQIVSDVRDAMRQVVYQSESVKAARKSIELAREQLKSEETRRSVEVTTTFQVLKFQQDLVTALSSELLARANYAKAVVALAHAEGRLGDRP